MTRKSYYLELPYHKKGDDLCFAAKVVQRTGDPVFPVVGLDAAETLLVHAEMLEAASRILLDLGRLALRHDVEITDSDTHVIIVTLDDALVVTNSELWEHLNDIDEEPDDAEDEDSTAITEDEGSSSGT